MSKPKTEKIVENTEKAVESEVKTDDQLIKDEIYNNIDHLRKVVAEYTLKCVSKVQPGLSVVEQAIALSRWQNFTQVLIGPKRRYEGKKK